MLTNSFLKITALTAALALAGTAFSGTALAQDDDEGDGTDRLENVTIIEVVYIKFKPGKRARAIEIMNEYFAPASAVSAGGPRAVLHFETGKWDIVILWELKGGFDDLMWSVSPEDLTWHATFSEIAGGEEEADAIWDEYISYMANSQTEVGHLHNPDDGDDE